LENLEASLLNLEIAKCMLSNISIMVIYQIKTSITLEKVLWHHFWYAIVMDTTTHSGGSRGKSSHGSPSSLTLDFGHHQRRDKRETLGNCPPAEWLDWCGP